MAHNTEQNDETKLKEFVTTLKTKTFDFLKMISEMDIEALAHCGHKTKEAALMYEIQRTAKEIEKAIRAHEHKWPTA